MGFRNNGGWALYADSQYPMGSGRVFTDAVEAKLTIDGLGTLTDTTYRPKVSVVPWNVTTNRIQQFVAGQVTSYRLFLFATPVGLDTRLFIKYRITGSINIAVQSVNLARGAGVRQAVVLTVPIFADPSSITNGIEVWLEASGSNVTVDTVSLMAIEQFIPV